MANPLRIGIDCRSLIPHKKSGIQTYVECVLHELARLDPVNEYFLYAHRDFPFDLPSSKWRKRHNAIIGFGSLWLQAELPFWIRQDKLDVFWGPQHVVPLLVSNKTKIVLSMCDVVYKVHPETMQLMTRFLLTLSVFPSMRRANAVLAISQSTMNDVERYFHPATPIKEVTLLAADSSFTPQDPIHSRELLKKQFGIEKPYLLTVGAMEPRKNMARAIEAFEQVADKIPHELVVAGLRGWKNTTLRKRIQRSRYFARIRVVGFVPKEQLPHLYSGADMFLFPSLYEGFGLAPLEAMACGCPVVASNTSSLPEVVGDAAVLVDPLSVSDIAQGISSLTENPAKRQEMSRRSLAQARTFSWESAARQTLNVFERVSEKSVSPAGDFFLRLFGKVSLYFDWLRPIVSRLRGKPGFSSAEYDGTGFVQREQSLSKLEDDSVLLVKYDSIAHSLWRSQEFSLIKQYRPLLSSPVMDFGCGDGSFGSMVFDRIDVGVDNDPRAIAVCQQQGRYGQLVLSTNEKIPLPAASVQSAFSNSVLEHVFNLPAMLSEINRVLRPGGVFILTVPTKNFGRHLDNFFGSGQGEKVNADYFHRNAMETADWEAMLKQHGFTVVEKKEYQPPRFTYWYRMSRLLGKNGLGFLIPNVQEFFWKVFGKRTMKMVRNSIDGVSNGANVLIVARKTS